MEISENEAIRVGQPYANKAAVLIKGNDRDPDVHQGIM